MKLELNPEQLDAQCPVKIDRWIDIDSEEAKRIDDNRAFTKKIIKIGFEGSYLFIDTHGRLWGKTKKCDQYSPLHIEHGNKLIGYRMSKNAAN